MKKRLALIGYGGMGKRHLNQLRDVDEIDVAGVWDISASKLKEAASSGYQTYSSNLSVLEDPAVDIVLIATPNDSHAYLAIDAMKAGKHVICEKPATLCLKDFQAMVDISSAYDRCLMIDQNRRWDENFLIVKNAVENGTIGQVFEIRNVVQGSRGIPDDWRRSKRAGGGIVYDWCVHLLDRILYLKQSVSLESVYAELSHVLGYEVDDGFRVNLQFSDGMRAILEAGTVNFIKLPEWYVSGTIGTMQIDDYETHGRIVKLRGKLSQDARPVEMGAGCTKTMAPRSDGSTVERPLPRVVTDVRDFYRNFCRWIDGEEEPKIKNDEVLQSMRIIELVFESARTNQVIYL